MKYQRTMQIHLLFALNVDNDTHYMPAHGENFASGFPFT